MTNIKDFDIKKGKTKKKQKKISKDIASVIKSTMQLGLSELGKSLGNTIKGGTNKEDIKKKDSIFVLNKGNQILPSEDERENKKIRLRKHKTTL